MNTIRKTAHEGAMVMALAGAAALSMLFAKGLADAVVYLGEIALR
jgi:hypothetical protein